MAEAAEWVRRLVGLVLLLGFVEFLLPPGETSRFARLVIGFSLLLWLIQPVASFLHGWQGGGASRESLVVPFARDDLPLSSRGTDASFDEAAARGQELFRRALERVAREAEDEEGDGDRPALPEGRDGR